MGAVHQNPLDAGPRPVYADWLEGRGRNGAADCQRGQAARWQAYDPDSSHEAILPDLDPPEGWNVAVLLLETSGSLWGMICVGFRNWRS